MSCYVDVDAVCAIGDVLVAREVAVDTVAVAVAADAAVAVAIAVTVTVTVTESDAGVVTIGGGRVTMRNGVGLCWSQC